MKKNSEIEVYMNKFSVIPVNPNSHVSLDKKNMNVMHYSSALPNR